MESGSGISQYASDVVKTSLKRENSKTPFPPPSFPALRESMVETLGMAPNQRNRLPSNTDMRRLLQFSPLPIGQIGSRVHFDGDGGGKILVAQFFQPPTDGWQMGKLEYGSSRSLLDSLG